MKISVGDRVKAWLTVGANASGSFQECVEGRVTRVFIKTFEFSVPITREMVRVEFDNGMRLNMLPAYLKKV